MQQPCLQPCHPCGTPLPCCFAATRITFVAAEMTEEVILDPPKIGIKLKSENVDIAYPPLFQSGGHYDLKLNAACDDNPLHDGEALALHTGLQRLRETALLVGPCAVVGASEADFLPPAAACRRLSFSAQSYCSMCIWWHASRCASRRLSYSAVLPAILLHTVLHRRHPGVPGHALSVLLCQHRTHIHHQPQQGSGGAVRGTAGSSRCSLRSTQRGPAGQDSHGGSCQGN